jgi:hypothetical protein
MHSVLAIIRPVANGDLHAWFMLHYSELYTPAATSNGLLVDCSAHC